MFPCVGFYLSVKSKSAQLRNCLDLYVQYNAKTLHMIENGRRHYNYRGSETNIKICLSQFQNCNICLKKRKRELKLDLGESDKRKP